VVQCAHLLIVFNARIRLVQAYLAGAGEVCVQ
jgi:hypothetical protein